MASNGSLVLFVGTKRQAKEAVEREAKRCGMPFVNERYPTVAADSSYFGYSAGGTFGLACVLIIRRLTEGERHDKAKLNDLLREHGIAT